MQEILERIVKELVTKKEEVKIATAQTDSIVILTIDVAQTDAGKIIGKNGVTIKALNTIFKAIYASQGKKCVLEIKDKKTEA